mgnify:FL=1
MDFRGKSGIKGLHILSRDGIGGKSCQNESVSYHVVVYKASVLPCYE